MTQTAAEINAATDASRAARTTQIANAPKAPSRGTRSAAKTAPSKAAPKPTATAKAPAAKAPATPATPPPPAPKTRKALTPRERAAKPLTENVATYVEWLERELGRKFTDKERQLAGISITLYGSYQTSPERRAARSAR